MTRLAKIICGFLIGIVTLLGILLAADRYLPNPAIKLSSDTTRITAPLDVDGIPDYVAYIHEQMKAGVTPENNAAALMWGAFWPGDLSPQYHESFCQALGIQIPDPAECLTPLDEDIKQRLADWLKDEFGIADD